MILPRVTEIIKSNDLIDTQYFNDVATSRGTAVHHACRLIDEDDLNWKTLHKDLHGYVIAYQKFKSEMRPDILCIEKNFEHKIYGFKGTPDRILKINRIRSILDIKTSQTPATQYRTWVKFQLAGYKILSKTKRHLAAQDRYALYLRPEGNYCLMKFTDPSDELGFLNLLAVHNIKKRMGVKDNADGNNSSGSS